MRQFAVVTVAISIKNGSVNALIICKKISDDMITIIYFSRDDSETLVG